MRTKYIILTGATGFLGSHMLKGLYEKTDYGVLILKRSTSDTKRIAEFLGSKRVETLDVDRDDTQLDVRFQEGNIEGVIHCATEYGRGRMPIANVLRTNLIFPIHLLDLCVKYGTRVFINTDSFFNKEKFEYPYLLDYSLSKKSLLMWLPYYAKSLRVANMTLEHIYGPRDGKDKFVTHMLEEIAIRQASEVRLSLGHQLRDFVYVDDVVEAYLLVYGYLRDNGACRVYEYNVGTGNSITVRRFVETIKQLSKSSSELLFGALPYREKEIMESRADVKQLKALGWMPRYDVTKGLATIMECIK